MISTTLVQRIFISLCEWWKTGEPGEDTPRNPKSLSTLYMLCVKTVYFKKWVFGLSYVRLKKSMCKAGPCWKGVLFEEFGLVVHVRSPVTADHARLLGTKRGMSQLIKPRPFPPRRNPVVVCSYLSAACHPGMPQ